MDDLATYLNDHLAGSEAGLELLEHIESLHADTPLADLAAGLQVEIADDRRELERLIERLGVGQGAARKAAAWVAEKFARVKLRLDDLGAGDLRRLEAWEALSLGVEGKRLLWQSLQAASERLPDLRGPDYPTLIRRADDQRRRIEAARIEFARTALAP